MNRLNALHMGTDMIEINTFRKINVGRYSPVIYTDKQITYDKLYLVKSDLVLPHIDVYNLCASSKSGVICGYAFDVYGRDNKINDNMILAYSSISLDVKNLQTKMNLQYRLKGCNIYVLPNQATLMTLSRDSKLKNLLAM